MTPDGGRVESERVRARGGADPHGRRSASGAARHVDRAGESTRRRACRGRARARRAASEPDGDKVRRIAGRARRHGRRQGRYRRGPHRGVRHRDHRRHEGLPQPHEPVPITAAHRAGTSRSRSC